MKNSITINQFVGGLAEPEAGKNLAASYSPGAVELTDQPDVGQPRPVLYREALMLYPGKFRAMIGGKPGDLIITEAHIDAALANFEQNERRVTMQTDHDMSVHKKIGNVLALRKVGTGADAELYGLHQVVGKYAVERVNDGRFLETSVGGINYSAEHPEEFTITENSVVAAGALPRAGITGKDGMQMSKPNAGTGESAEAGINEEHKQGLSLLSKMAQFFSGGGAAPAAAPVAPAPAPVAASVPNAELEALKAQVAAQQTQLEAITKEKDEAKASQILNDFIKAGQIPPAAKDSLKAHLATCSAEQTTSLAAFLGSMPKLVQMGVTKSDPTPAEVAEEAEDEQLYQQAKARLASKNTGKPVSATAPESGIVIGRKG